MEEASEDNLPPRREIDAEVAGNGTHQLQGTADDDDLSSCRSGDTRSIGASSSNYDASVESDGDYTSVDSRRWRRRQRPPPPRHFKFKVLLLWASRAIRALFRDPVFRFSTHPPNGIFGQKRFFVRIARERVYPSQFFPSLGERGSDNPGLIFLCMFAMQKPGTGVH